jgi:hypothetical protein
MIRLRRALLMATLSGLAVLLALTALFLRPSHTSAATLVPFQASVSETFTIAKCGQWSVCITAIGTGQATHLGNITEDSSIVADINPADQHNGCAPETRTTTLTAANGDTITMSGTGLTRCPGSNEANDSYVVTGGTGRFQGASGSGTDNNIHTQTGPGVGVALTTYSGNLSSVGSLDP